MSHRGHMGLARNISAGGDGPALQTSCRTVWGFNLPRAALLSTTFDARRPPRGIATAIYVLTGMIYCVFSCKEALVNRSAPRSLPIWLDMLSLQYLSGDTVQRISPDTALLRWASCVFFVSSPYEGDDTSQQFLPSATTHIVSN